MPSRRTHRSLTIALAAALVLGAVTILILAYAAAFHGWLTAVPTSASSTTPNAPASTEHAHAAHAATANGLLVATAALLIAEFVGVVWLRRRVRRGPARG